MAAYKAGRVYKDKAGHKFCFWLLPPEIKEEFTKVSPIDNIYEIFLHDLSDADARLEELQERWARGWKPLPPEKPI